jgi:site-specific recombinase XerD
MLSAGEDVRSVQAWLGHVNIATTQMYRSHLDAAEGATKDELTNSNHSKEQDD